jgi:hypothetical protein
MDGMPARCANMKWQNAGAPPRAGGKAIAALKDGMKRATHILKLRGKPARAQTRARLPEPESERN